MKRLFCITMLLILCMATSVYGATRQEIQIALDLVRFVNVPNDLFDYCGEQAKEQTLSIAEKKSILERTSQNVRGYINMIDKFLSVQENRTQAINGLSVLDIDITNIQNDTQNMRSVADEVEKRLLKAKTKEDVDAIADYIKQNIETLPLVRKSKAIIQ